MNTKDRTQNTHLLGPAISRQLILRSSKKSIDYQKSVDQQLAKNQLECDHDLEENSVSIKVGQGSNITEFIVPKRPLCSKISFFDAMFNHEWLETSTQSCTLPDDDPEAFSILMHWVFDVTHDAPVTFTVEGLPIHSKPFMDPAIMADKYLVDDLPDIIETRLVQKDMTRLNDPSHGLPTAPWYRLALELLPRASILRRYFGSLNESGYKFIYRNGILVEPKTLEVTIEILREWAETCAGRKDISQELEKFRTFRYARDRHSSGRICPSLSWIFRGLCDYRDFFFCSAFMLDEDILRHFRRTEPRMSQIGYLHMHIHR
ncbi:uncharacterized protein EAE97_010341 [Botrytis byssoidea]|uniref:BTB domain-containing protein n=1 Tax=Botrytis byssoidea TaxID=139641 RepID=A0A9P5LVC6_9HELO|nr:uncharacterized protein EAE97_010341 [Botrytis byssoidea]KAF7926041.1 hypothetical protein EAE97_010341 [Botrytis byssoidea]